MRPFVLVRDAAVLAAIVLLIVASDKLMDETEGVRPRRHLITTALSALENFIDAAKQMVPDRLVVKLRKRSKFNPDAWLTVTNIDLLSAEYRNMRTSEGKFIPLDWSNLPSPSIGVDEAIERLQLNGLPAGMDLGLALERAANAFYQKHDQFPATKDLEKLQEAWQVLTAHACRHSHGPLPKEPHRVLVVGGRRIRSSSPIYSIKWDTVTFDEGDDLDVPDFLK